MDDLKLISLVESFDEVYNKSNPEYKSAEKKKEAWTMISHAMGYSPEDCMRRWTSLRDRFVREKRLDFENQESGNVSSTESKFRWPLMESMEFITPHTAPRGKRIYKKLTKQELLSNDERQQDSKYDNQLRVKVQQSPIDPLESYSPLSSPQLIPMEQSPPPSPSIPEPEYTLARKRKRNQSEDVTETDKLFTEAVEKFKEICKTREEKAKKQEQDLKKENIALHSFGQMILATISSMSHINQAKAMKEVTEVVMRIKMESHTPQLNEFMHQFQAE